MGADFPSQNVFFEDGLNSPLTKEFTLSGGAAIGSRGYAKLSYIARRASDFVEDFVTADGGSTVITGNDGTEFGTFSNLNFRNTDVLERDYDGLEFQGRFQATDSWLIDGSYTAQINNDGNFEGEARGQGAISSNAFDYPEITPATRYFPTGRLENFQRHKVRIWSTYILDIGRAGALDLGGIWRYNSGRAYSISADFGTTAIQEGILADLGYVDGPSSRTIYFSGGRGSETWDGYGLLDLAVNYRIPVWDSLSPRIKFELFNVFNNDKQIGGNTSVSADPDSPVDELGIPTGFIEGSNFGEATSVNPFPQYIANLDGLRTFRMSLGLTF